MNIRREEREINTRNRDAKKRMHGRLWSAFLWSILIFCVSLMAIQIPKVISCFKEEKPIRIGTYSTDEDTDQCIRNLWSISKSLQEGEMPNEKTTCPISNKPYKKGTEGGNPILCCPNPEKHGFTEIRVSKKNPVPEAIK
jgi:hypothetical protein